MADGSVIIDTKLDESGLKEGLDKLGGKVAKGITTAITATTAALAAGSAAVVKYGSDFESAFAGVKKTVDASDAELAALKQGILDMSSVIPEAASDIAAVTEAAGQLGIKNDSLLSFTETMVNLGVATNLSATDAASSLAKFANVVNMNAADFDKLGSTIVALGNASATTESDIVLMATRLASTGAIVGLSESQIMAVATALSSVGIEAEAGGTAISKLLKQIETAASTYGTAKSAIDSTGYSLRELELLADQDSKAFKEVSASLGLTSSELKGYMSNVGELESFSNVAGMSADAFIKAWGDDSISALDTFIMGLNDTERNGASAIEILEDMGITEVRTSNALLSLAKSNGILTSSVNLANEAWEENSALANEAAQRYETFDSKLIMLKNSAKNFAVSMYDEIQEPLKEVTSYATGLVGELSTAFAEGGLDGLMDAVGGVLGDILTKIVENAPMIVGAASDILISLIGALVENADKIGEGIGGVMVVLAEAIVKAIPLLLEGFLKVITAIAEKIAEALPAFIPLLIQGVINLANALLDNIEPLIEAGMAIIQGLIKGLIAALPLLISALPRIIQKIASLLPTLINTLSEMITENQGIISEAFVTIFGAIVEVLPVIIETLVAILPDIVNAMVGALQAQTQMMVNCGIALLTALIDALPTIINVIVAVLPTIISAVIDALLMLIPLLIDCGIQLLTSLVDALPEIITAIIAVLPDIIVGIVSALIDMKLLIMQAGFDLFVALVKSLPKIIIELVKAVPKIITAIIDGFKNNWGKMKEAGSDIISKIGDGFKSAVDIGKNLVQGIWNGIINAKDWILEKIKGFGDAVLGGLKDFFGIHSPSTLMEDMIGKNLSLGIAEGIADESDSAVDAMTDVADKIKNAKFEDDFDYSFALQRVVSTVNTAAEQNAARISGDSNPHRQIPTKDTKSDKTNPEGSPAYIENVINIDGKTVARVVTPYVEKELAWRNK